MKPGSAEARNGGGSFTRIEVISMLKLVTMCVLGAGTVLLFTIIAYAGSPPVATSDFTSSGSRCVSEFSRTNFLACANDTNVTSLPKQILSAVGSSPTDVVDTLLRLTQTEEVTMLGCMLDKCTATTSRPMSVGNPETELLFAHYSFGIDGITQTNRYFYLQVSFPNNDTTKDSSFAVTLTPHVRGYYKSAGENLSFVDLLPDQTSQLLVVDCEEGKFFCEAEYFLRFTEIDFIKYRVDVLFNSTDPLPINGRDPQFRKTWGTTQFTHWMLGIKYFFLIVSMLLVIWYNRNLNLLNVSELTMEQNWVLALGIALVLYNDPFYALEASMGGSSLKILTVLFQATFFQMLLLFWLIALDNLRLQGREAGMSNRTFFVPKVSFVCFFWLIQVCYHGYIKYYMTNDPTWDPLETNHNFALLRALMALCSLVYLGWFVTLCALSRNEVKAKRPRYRYLLFLSFWMVLICFMGLGAGSFSPTPTSGGSWTSYVALFNVYVFMLEYLYAPSASTLRAAKARIVSNGKDVDPEARPALAAPEVETAGVELELA